MTERRKELDIEPALVPQVWEDAVAACLAKDPSRRPQSAAEVAQRLQLTPAQTRTRVAPGKRSNRKALLIGGIAALFGSRACWLYFGVLKRQAKPVSQAPAIPEKSIAVLPFRKPERRQSQRLLCRRHPGRDSDALIQDRRSEGHLAHIDAALQKRAGKPARDRQATWRRPHPGRKRAEERRRRACERAANQSSQ